jgi:dTDP-4-amino-4,6-dideoxygalactose transaminase
MKSGGKQLVYWWGFLQRFEEDFARYCGTKYSIGCGNGLDAIMLALRGLGIGAETIIVPSFTFIATALAVDYAGAKLCLWRWIRKRLC